MPTRALHTPAKGRHLGMRPLWAEREKAHSDVAYPRLPIRPGDRVLDVGCGHGQTTFELVDRVGVRGAVVGLEADRGAVEVALAEQLAGQIENVAFLVGDPASVPLPAGSFDVAVSRFRLDLQHAVTPLLARTRRALCSGGVLGLLCWRGPLHNPWWSEPRRLAERVLGPEGLENRGGLPQTDVSPHVHRTLLHAAGFENVRHQRIEPALCLGRDVDHALAVVLGLLGRTGCGLGQVPAPELESELRGLLASWRRADGSVWSNSSSWFITARAPAVSPGFVVPPL